MRASWITALAAAWPLLSPATFNPPQWSALPPIPDEHGVAGAFAGMSGNHLIVGGGANFPGGMPWDGGAKVWTDQVYALELSAAGTPADGAAWRVAGRLPRPNGYGVSITLAGGVLCAGGGDATNEFSSVFLLHLENGRLLSDPLPDLPAPLANAAGVELKGRVYVAGGQESPAATTAVRGMWSLDPARPAEGWRVEAVWDGPGRILPLMAVRGSSLFLCSGAELKAGPDGKPVRTYLKDAHQFTPGKGWARIADMPRAAVAAPSPAPAFGQSSFLVLGGDDGSLVDFQPKSAHPGFLRGVLAYDTVIKTWSEPLRIPAGLPAQVTAPVVPRGPGFLVVSGEIRPAVRTPAVSFLRPSASSQPFGWINWTVVALYLGGMIYIGFWFMKRDSASSTEAYFRGGQRVPWWVAGLSIFATMLSSITFMAIPARAYQTDISWYIGQLPILIVVPMVVFFYLPFFRKLDLTSAYEYLEKRFGIAARIFASLSFILFHVGRTAIVLYLPALALATVSDISVDTSIYVCGVLCLIYTVMGGITAVVWTDAVQAIVLMGGAVLCLVLSILRVDGGLPAVWDIAVRDEKLFDSLKWTDFSVADGTLSAAVLFVAFLFNALVPYTSSQDVVQRYVTTKDISSARRSLWTTMVLSIFCSMVFFLMGTAIYAFFKTNPALLDPTLAKTDSILPFYIMQQLPVGVSGLIIAALFAASQSTVSSSLNSMATAYIKDFDGRLFRPGRDDRTYLAGAKWVVILTGAFGIALAVWMAHSNIESAFKTFNTIIGLTAGALGGLFALGVFTRRANGTGAMVGAFTATALVVWMQVTRQPVTGLLFAFIGCAATFVVGYLASLVLPGRRGENLSIFG
ncbi:MAG: sodium/solute symporter [Kiritimatiellia bacterium]